jgi:type IV pilus assembly protein PilY1
MTANEVRNRVLSVVLALLAWPGAPAPALAGDVDLATAPLVSGLSKAVPPNVHFVLDDSGSMGWEYMPDDVDGNRNSRCFKNFGYNRIYYNPSINYVPPVNADSTSFPNQVFTSARVNGFSGTASTNLATAFDPVWMRLDNPAFSMTKDSNAVRVRHTSHGLTAGQTVKFSNAGTVRGIDMNNTFTIASVVSANEYVVTAGNNANATGTGASSARVELPFGWYEFTSNPAEPPSTCAANNSYRWRRPQSVEEQQNYANWYSYYRTRVNMMKSASGRAFATVDNRFRVGLDVISNETTNSVKVNIGRFEGAKRTDWYTRLYAAGASGATPLRSALSKAGRLYAGKVVTGNNDPVHYSCQQNFTILTTDGYWNVNDEVPDGDVQRPPSSGTFGNASSNYGPFREDNFTVVGDQDGVAGTPRPYLDAGKYPNTIADVAMYYYKTDLRPTGTLGGLPEDSAVRLDVSKNNVPTAGPDDAVHQHMTTFALGLGVAGTLGFHEDYLIGASADYNAILQGTKNWPNPKVNDVGSQIRERVDDTWHAAVNGRGRYLSASNPDAVITALRKTLAAISVTNASAAAAATSSLEPVTGDNYAYIAQYTTGLWYGDLLAREIDLTTGALSTDVIWSAQTELGKKVGADSDSRRIYTFDGSTSSKLRTFTADQLVAEIAAGYFRSDAANPKGKLSQYDTWSSDQRTDATSAAMIALIRGHTENQGQPDDTSKLFRDRTYALGDIVSAAPVFVRRPPFQYSDAGYTEFANDNSGRRPVVYAGANDGMLHAFDGDTGEELWAYIPSVVVPYLYKLADAGYANNHRFFVDGPITVGDVYDGSQWRTVLVAGLGGGGKAYFALDITDPDSPKALWEFGTAQDDDMGFSYGNPIVTKRASDGTWVVLFASGYNNNQAGGDGKGRLFVVNATTGARLAEIITSNAVTDADLSGIAKLNNYVPNGLVDNTTEYVYGGDLSGALWRFDLLNGTSMRLGRTSATAGNQPITLRPELGRIRDSTNAYHRVIFFGTGRYLGPNDLTDTSKSSTEAQAFYAVKDTGSDLGVFPVDGDLQAQVLDSTVTPRSIPSPAPVNWATQNGWYVTLPVGERVNVDLRLQLGTLVALSNQPDNDYCTVGGVSWLYAFDFSSGAAVSTSTNREVGFPVGSSIATGLTLVRLPNNKLVAIVTQADTTVRAMSVPVAPPAAAGVRRVGWREIP